jgi:AcrR family transcriptional regulator
MAVKVPAQTGNHARMTAVARREQLLDATKAIAVRRGFHSVSIEAVAREAGITRPVVYGHFHDLPGLLDALVDRETARSLAQLETVLDYDLAGPDPAEKLLASLGAYLEAVRSDPDTWRLVLMPQEGAPASLRERIAQGRTAVVGRLARAVGPGIGAGGESPDPELTARMLSAIADEAARLLLTDPGQYPVERILDHTRWVLGQLAPRE